MEERRYRQQGYKQYEKDSQARPQTPAGSGTPAMPQTRSVARCADCGALLLPLTDPHGQCPKCRAELHACRQCTHFDSSRRFECTQSLPERIANKSARNECTFFSMQVALERDASSGGMRPDDARRAIDNLFKK
jgi:hypothetical protein